VFVNAPGGIKVVEPASDLAVAAAIVSAVTGTPADRETAWTGEIGLTGEVRWVGRMEPRVTEVRKLGLKKIVVPESCLSETAHLVGEDMQVVGIPDVSHLLELAGT
jgi:DNA repair protein RadA/Sms